MRRVFRIRPVLAIPQPLSDRLDGGKRSIGWCVMSFQAAAGFVDYLPCRYGMSRTLFRGPARDLARPYVAFLGGSATFGKQIARPFPELVEQASGVPCVNLGALNAGPDFYLSDPAVLDIVAGARAAVLQVPGVDAVSNAFYTVHSRRNDRFLAATPALRRLFPEVDFTEIHFTRHLLTVLARIDASRFSLVRQVLAATWLSRMELLLDRLPQRRLLLWLGDRPPGREGADLGSSAPLFVDQAMLAALAPAAGEVMVASADDPAAAGADLARFLPGAGAHRAIAARVTPWVAARTARPPAPLILQPWQATA